jgi:hypothetical protein
MRAYMDGYTAALEKAKKEADEPYIDFRGIMERYGGRIGENRAREIIRAVRHCCNGGKLQSSSIILRAELEYWESVVDPKYLERLSKHEENSFLSHRALLG